MLGLAVLVAWVVGLLAIAAVAVGTHAVPGRMRPQAPATRRGACRPVRAGHDHRSASYRRSFGAIEAAIIVVSATLVLLRHTRRSPCSRRRSARRSPRSRSRTAEHPDRRGRARRLHRGRRARPAHRRLRRPAGIAGLLVVVGIQNPRTSCPARCSQQWPGRRSVAAGDLLGRGANPIVAAEERPPSRGETP